MKFFLLLVISLNLFAVNSLLENNDIIDIGHNTTGAEVEVPKQKISTDPRTTLTPNSISYQKRIESQKINCQTDFLNTEVCGVQQSTCPSNETFTQSYSVPHNISKTFLKICPYGTTKISGKCYVDNNGDNIPDKFIHYYDVNESVHICLDHAATVTTSVINGKLRIRMNTGVYNCGGAGHYDVTLKDDVLNGDVRMNTLASAGCLGFSGMKGVVRSSTDGISSLTNGFSSVCGASGAQFPTVQFVGNYSLVTCPNGAKSTKEGTCYKTSTCPFDTTEQTDGSCLMDYTWYSYKCPTDTNEYDNPWRAIDAGSDCGSSSCTNSSTPPNNNCVRTNYTCPINGNAKCSKVAVIENQCADGYVWKDNTCERIEKYCGESIYNSALDICQNIISSPKKCLNPNDVYNKELDKCESVKKACPNGKFNKETGVCNVDIINSCITAGYVYNSESGTCIDKDKPLCDNENYTYDALSNSCIYAFPICKDGFAYNQNTNKCEQKVCDIMDTHRNGTRCETNSLCNGTLTGDGKCIPTQKPSL